MRSLRPCLALAHRAPATGGRIVDIFLEMTAICLVTGIAGAFASFFLELERENSGDADHRGVA